MSRSYKKIPHAGNQKRKSSKRYANKIVRKINYSQTPQHNTYKKVYGSYNICDYERVGTTYFEYLRGSQWHNELEDCEENFQDYQKYYIRK